MTILVEFLKAQKEEGLINIPGIQNKKFVSDIKTPLTFSMSFGMSRRP